MAHWYRTDGTLVEKVPKKSSPGEWRDATLTDARKMGLVPSATEVIRSMSAPGLTRWQVQEAIKASLKLDRAQYMTDAAYIADVIAKAWEEADAKRNLGVEIHADIERSFREEPPLERSAVVQAVHDELAEIGLDWKSEQSFYCSRTGLPAFGGTIDLMGVNEGGSTILVDVKTKEVVDDKAAVLYDEHLAQLALYSLYCAPADVFNLFVGYDGTTRLVRHTNEQRVRGLNIGVACLQLWYARSGL